MCTGQAALQQACTLSCRLKRLTSPVTLFTAATLQQQLWAPSAADTAASTPGSSSANRCLLHSKRLTSDQCQPLTFLPSSRCSTSQRGSPSPHLAIFGGQSGSRRYVALPRRRRHCKPDAACARPLSEHHRH